MLAPRGVNVAYAQGAPCTSPPVRPLGRCEGHTPLPEREIRLRCRELTHYRPTGGGPSLLDSGAVGRRSAMPPGRRGDAVRSDVEWHGVAASGVHPPEVAAVCRVA